MDQNDKIIEDVIHLARFGSEGRSKDVKALARRMAHRYRESHPSLSAGLATLSTGGGVTRLARRPMPVDADSRMALARMFEPSLAQEPILPRPIASKLNQVIAEHRDSDRLKLAGLAPVKTVLLIGAPGVGKTMAAHWVAAQLNRPLVLLDLAASISSFLGKSGQNLRQLFDFGREFECVLMLDEVDAIAKKRSDETDLGELKRLVNVLLQELDEWPEGGLLIAATNHPELLDAAVWRRFDVVIELPLPGHDERARLVTRTCPSWSTEGIDALAALSDGMNYAEIDSHVRRGRKTAVLAHRDELEAVLAEFSEVVQGLPNAKRQDISKSLIEAGLSQRKAAEITGTSRNTIRKNSQKEASS